jgi:hypothetical protein
MKAIAIVSLVFLCAGCAGVQKVATTTPEQEAAAKPVVLALQAGNFEEAQKAAQAVLGQDPQNPQAGLVSGIARYQEVMHNFYRDMTSIIGGAFVGRAINHRMLKWSLQQAEAELEKVERDLSGASAVADVRLQLCLGCWERDWNHNGEVDERDRLLFQIELDANGELIPEGDPRRKPTFHFDLGDVFWARAMVAFQRAAFNLVLAYQLPEMSELMGASRESAITIKMVDKSRVLLAKELILSGLEHADRARLEYLRETDDVGEWVPNPKQKNHPLPLPVDEMLYETWEGVLRDLRALLKGEEGISVAEVAQLGDHQWENPPQGFVNIKKLLEEPGDIVIRLDHVDALEGERSRENAEKVIKDILGEKYVPEMKPTPLLKRLVRMKGEMERGEESFERKLRYLFWLN